MNELRFIHLIYFSNVSEELDDLRRCLADTNEELIETKKRSNSRNSRTSIMLKQPSVSWKVYLIGISVLEWKNAYRTWKNFLKVSRKEGFRSKDGGVLLLTPSERPIHILF